METTINNEELEHKNKNKKEPFNKRKKLVITSILACIFLITGIIVKIFSGSNKVMLLENRRPVGMMKAVVEDDGFVDTPGRVNMAFNVGDFGPQGSNGWLYKKGDPSDPETATKLKFIEKEEKYIDYSIKGIEIKKDFIHTGEDTAPILEWRVAQDGIVNVQATYVKSVNGDKNPSFPDGVTLNVYHEDKVIANKKVDIEVDRENIAEIEIKDVEVKKGESIYFVVDPNKNNAYDGGILYATITDPKLASEDIGVDTTRQDNNANSIDDFGSQGNNGWYYQSGTTPEDARYVSTFKETVYLDNTTPSLEIQKDFIHPGVNRGAILKWVAYHNSNIDVKLNYTKFEQHDGNPSWPDGVKIRVYHNNDLLTEEIVDVFENGDNEYSFKLKDMSIKEGEELYFVVLSNENGAWDGGKLEVNIKDKSAMQNENNTAIPNDHLRTNNASTVKDFGTQGNNGWFYQFGEGDNPFDAENIRKYEKDEKYYNDRGLEIKKDFIQPGDKESAIVKWKVAKDGNVKIIANYTKFIDNDPNPYWADGTNVTLYHNNKAIKSKNFEANRVRDIFEDMSIDKLNVKKGDYITLVVNGKKNNAYDGGSYTVTIKDLDNPLVDTTIKDNNSGKNIASNAKDFGAQGNNGWYYLCGNTPDNLRVIDEYDDSDEKYFSSSAPGLEIKKDFIHPSLENGAALQWIAALDGNIDILGEYVKFKHEDSNVNYPDGTTIKVYINNKIILDKKVTVDNIKDNVIPLLMQNIKVNKGDKVSFIVTANGNTSFDGGRINVNIQPSINNSGDKEENNDAVRKNIASLEKDFGIQDNNGWSFGYGTNSEDFAKVIGYSEDEGKYYQPGLDGLEIKKDFVQPAVDKGAIYRWIVGEDGKIDLKGKYTKFTHADENVNWPDGVKLTVYHNNKVLQENVVSVSTDKENIRNIDVKALDVKKGDKIYFIITANKNNAWDGGRLSVNIYPTLNNDNSSEDNEEENNEIRKNISSLEKDFGIQDNNGWSFGYGTSSKDFAKAIEYIEDEGKYCQPGLDGLEIKKDFVQPAVDMGAIYRWIVGENGKIDLAGNYTKFKHADGNPNWPDGVKLTIYHNNKILKEKAVSVSNENDIVEDIDIKALDVKKGDKIYFIITANENNAWDGGRLSVEIYPTLKNDNSSEENKEDSEVDNEEVRENTANLKNDFGVQGNNGWNFGIGTSCHDFKQDIGYNEADGKYEQPGLGGLEIKNDFVQPAEAKGAIYRWTVGKDGKIDLTGNYTKFKHADGNPNWPDGVKLTIYHNDKILKEKAVSVSNENDIVEDIDIKSLDVKKGDKIYFIITANENNAWDGGRLEVSIKPV